MNTLEERLQDRQAGALALEAARLEQTAVMLQAQVTELSRGFLAEKVRGCDGFELPPGSDEVKNAFLASEIEQEKAILKAFV